MGAVYKVQDERTDAHRALKIMLPTLVQDLDLRSRFEREARITANIESDHLVRVLDAAIDAETGTPFLVMDLLHGKDLRAILQARGALPASEVLTYLSQTALALDKTHAAGIVHRDLKPDNLFITHRDDGSPCVKILDFGIAKIIEASKSTHATKLVGTPVYMSPEQIRGMATLGPHLDVYTLGQIAYTLLTGEAYWQEEFRASESIFPLLERLLQGAVEPASVRAQRRRGVALPPAFDAWFARSTARDPEHRFDRATLAVSALAEVLGAGGATPRPAQLMTVAILDEADRTTKRLAPGAITSETPVVSSPMCTSTTTAAVSNELQSLARPRSRVPIVAGAVIAGLIAVIGLGVMLARPHPVTSAVSTATKSTAAAESPSAPVVSLPSFNLLPSSNEAPVAALVSAAPSLTASATASPAARRPKKAVAFPQPPPPREPSAQPAAEPPKPKYPGID